MTKQYLSENEELMKEWDWEANKDLDPTKITIGSHKKVYWNCLKCNHKWQQAVIDRTRKRSPAHCPCCTSRFVIKGVNDFASFSPEDAKEWHPTKNGTTKPTDIRPKSNRKYWWQCSKCGNEWQATGNNRIGHKSGCPACAGRVPVVGVSDLFTVCPELKDEWDGDLNKEVNVATIPIGSHTKVWWKCSRCGNQWQAEVRRRVKGLSKCPECHKK